ncbi:MAG: hypothetical protein R3C18_26675 [Planctomycetaceae bacterium]
MVPTSQFGVAIVPNPKDRRRRPYAFAVHGKFASIQQCAKWYKRRFSIESSYREAKQIRGWTTSHNGKWRRLLQVLSFMLRNLWLWFSWLSQHQSRKPPPLRLHQLQDAPTAQLGLTPQPPPAILVPD